MTRRRQIRLPVSVPPTVGRREMAEISRTTMAPSRPAPRTPRTCSVSSPKAAHLLPAFVVVVSLVMVVDALRLVVTTPRDTSPGLVVPPLTPATPGLPSRGIAGAGDYIDLPHPMARSWVKCPVVLLAILLTFLVS